MVLAEYSRLSDCAISNTMINLTGATLHVKKGDEGMEVYSRNHFNKRIAGYAMSIALKRRGRSKIAHRLKCSLQENRAWYALSEEELLEQLSTSREGISHEEASQRRRECGENTLPEAKRPTLWVIFFRQFMSPLIYILIAAGIASTLIGEMTDAAFIFLIILINAILGSYQEYKAEQSAAALQELIQITTKVRRAGETDEQDAKALVPGDIVLLESGKRVPADIRLLESRNLTIDESILTGESQASEKKSQIIAGANESVPVADQYNMAFSGTTVISGSGMGVVVGTGTYSQVGQIAKTVASKATAKTPLVTRMETFTRKIAIFFLGAVLLLSIIIFFKGYHLQEIIITAIALAVSTIPEGVPVAMTVALSIGARRMAERHVIVRKLVAVEGLGSCTYIASDKTGTLTLNKQTVKVVSIAQGRHYTVTGEGYRGEGKVQPEGGEGEIPEEDARLLRHIAWMGTICNDAVLKRKDEGQWYHEGDPIDVSILAFAYKMGFQPMEEKKQVETLREIPYTSELAWAAKAFRSDNRVIVSIKGATEKLLPHCHQVLTAEGSIPLDVAAAEKEATTLAENGYRVILVAEGEISSPEAFSEGSIPELTLLGFFGMIDPVRPEAPQAVREAQEAGVKVTMVTGDHPATALAIARQLGIATDRREVMTGAEIDQFEGVDDPDFLEQISRISVFARVSPIQKLYITEGIKKKGHYIAVTGDGINDTPALRAAHIGVAMGSGSDITKDTALIIVADDNFASIEAGIEEGRYAYENVRKVIFLLISASVGEVIMMITAVLLNLPLPLFALQILWLNIVTNGVQDIALAFEAGEKGIMKRPPRDPKEGIFDAMMIQENLVAGLVVGLVGLGTWWWLLGTGQSEFAARNQLLLMLVLMENIHVFNCRSEYQSVFRIPLRNNWILVIAVFIAQGIHIVSMYIPFMQNILQIQPVSGEEWLTMLIPASSLLIAMEIFKYIKRHQLERKQPQHLPAHP